MYVLIENFDPENTLLTQNSTSSSDRYLQFDFGLLDTIIQSFDFHFVALKYVSSINLSDRSE